MGENSVKIIIVQESDWLKRNNHQQHHLAELMSLRNHQVRVIDFEIMWNNSEGTFAKREVFNDVKKIYDGAKVTVIRPSIIRLPVFDYFSILITHRNEINRQIKEFQPDIVVGFSILNSFLAVSACKRNNIPFIYYWIDVLHELIPFAPFRMLGELIEVLILDNADKVLAINQKLKELAVDLGGCGKKSLTLGAGIDKSRFNPNIDGKSLRANLGFKDDDVVLFYMGWLYEFSGLKEIINQMGEIKYDKLKLVIVGDGDEFSNLNLLKDMSSVSQNILMLGKLSYDEIPKYISASDICILPSYPDHKVMKNIIPIKVYEYLAMNKPVFSTKIPAVMAEFPTGIHYVDKLDNMVSEIMRHIKGVKTISELNCSIQQKSWAKITDEFEQILEHTIREKNGQLQARV